MHHDTIAITGSIATDHLMHFPGRFADQLIANQLDHVSLSFLVDDLVVHRGGVGANIAFGMGVLGQAPLLLGAVGADFADYRTWLETHGVDCSGILTVDTAHTPRFTCTTDNDQCQIASFYPGAMSYAHQLALGPALKSGNVELVLIGANDPAAMLAHTREARQLNVPFAADPSQQLPRLGQDDCRALIDGARYLFTNEYEADLLAQKTGWSHTQITDRLGLWVTTLAEQGARISGRDGTDLHIDALPAHTIADPTGAGDAFRAGFLAGRNSDLPLDRSAQLGALLATLVLEHTGTQEWPFNPDTCLQRLRTTYGTQTARDLEPLLHRSCTVRP